MAGKNMEKTGRNCYHLQTLNKNVYTRKWNFWNKYCVHIYFRTVWKSQLLVLRQQWYLRIWRLALKISKKKSSSINMVKPIIFSSVSNRWTRPCTLEIIKKNSLPEGESVVVVVGQDFTLQASVSLACPTQSFPPFFGAGLVQFLSLYRVPLPQLLVQFDQGANTPHSPSTWAWNQFKTFR